MTQQHVFTTVILMYYICLIFMLQTTEIARGRMLQGKKQIVTHTTSNAEASNARHEQPRKYITPRDLLWKDYDLTPTQFARQTSYMLGEIGEFVTQINIRMTM